MSNQHVSILNPEKNPCYLVYSVPLNSPGRSSERSWSDCRYY